MSNKLGYQLYSVRHPNEADSRMFPPGLFQWVEAFNRYGKFGKMNANIKKDNLEESDVIHVNVTPTNISYLAALREELFVLWLAAVISVKANSTARPSPAARPVPLLSRLSIQQHLIKG